MTRGLREHNRSCKASNCSFPNMKVLLLIAVIFPFILADQNLAAAQLPFVFIMSDADSVKKPKSPHDELLKERFDHIKKEWMQDHPNFLRVLVKENIKQWYDFQRFLENLDVVNSVKNRKEGDESTEKDPEHDNSLYWLRRCRYALSYVNELQIEEGIIRKSLVDITCYDYEDFCTYCDRNPPFQAYSNKIARENVEQARERELQLREAEARASEAEARRDAARDEAYGHDYRTNSNPGRSHSRSNSERSRTSQEGSHGYGTRVRSKPIQDILNAHAARGTGTKPRPKPLWDILDGEDNDMDNLRGTIGGRFPSSGKSVGSRRSNNSSRGHKSRHSSSSSQRKQRKQQSKMKHFYRGAGGGGGDDSSSSSSSSSSSKSSRNIPSLIGAGGPDGARYGKHQYKGVWKKKKPKTKI